MRLSVRVASGALTGEVIGAVQKSASLCLVYLLLVGCDGAPPDEPAKETGEKRDYQCSACGDYGTLDDAMQQQAEEAGCSETNAGVEAGIGCTVGDEAFSNSHYLFENCSQAPACYVPDDGVGGAGWDHQCFLCGDESDVDGVHDNGVEDAHCSESDISVSPVADCISGLTAWVVSFSDCDGVPSCPE